MDVSLGVAVYWLTIFVNQSLNIYAAVATFSMPLAVEVVTELTLTL